MSNEKGSVEKPVDMRVERWNPTATHTKVLTYTTARSFCILENTCSYHRRCTQRTGPSCAVDLWSDWLRCTHIVDLCLVAPPVLRRRQRSSCSSSHLDAFVEL